jgi:acyl carrier protein
METNTKDIVLNSLKEYFDSNDIQDKEEFSEKTKLYGTDGSIDSLGLVNLITIIEQNIEDKMGLTLILADENVLILDENPFKDVGSLCTYVNSLIEKEKMTK